MRDTAETEKKEKKKKKKKEKKKKKKQKREGGLTLRCVTSERGSMSLSQKTQRTLATLTAVRYSCSSTGYVVSQISAAVVAVVVVVVVFSLAAGGRRIDSRERAV